MIRRIFEFLMRRKERKELNVAVAMPDDNNYRYPIFSVGDSVIIANPYFNGEFTSDNPPYHTKITRVAYVEDIDMFAYQVEGSTAWYNENWLDFDEYGPATFTIAFKESQEVEEERKRKLEIDYWLASLAHEKAKGNEEGVQEAINELNRLRGNDEQ